MRRPAIHEVPGLWDADGSLRDLYVLHTSAGDWEAFLEFATRFPCAYSYAGEARTVPTAAQLFSDRDGSHLLSVTVGSATVNCHFFVETEIELNLAPEQMKEANAHLQVLQFVEGLAVAATKPVLLTPENGPNIPYLSYEPTSGAWQVHS